MGWRPILSFVKSRRSLRFAGHILHTAHSLAGDSPQDLEQGLALNDGKQTFVLEIMCLGTPPSHYLSHISEYETKTKAIEGCSRVFIIFLM